MRRLDLGRTEREAGNLDLIGCTHVCGGMLSAANETRTRPSEVVSPPSTARIPSATMRPESLVRNEPVGADAGQIDPTVMIDRVDRLPCTSTSSMRPSLVLTSRSP